MNNVGVTDYADNLKTTVFIGAVVQWNQRLSTQTNYKFNARVNTID